MTRLGAVVGATSVGSLMFPVELPGMESSFLGTSFIREVRVNGRKDVDAVLLSCEHVGSPANAELLDDVRALKKRGAAVDASSLARGLRELGYNAQRVMQHASNVAASPLRLAHEFVVVSGCGPEPLVVEPNFREHFSIGSIYATERYRQVLAAVPEELVAPYSRLRETVQLVCREMKWSFEANGNSVPPWRSANTILSRWSPVRGSV